MDIESVYENLLRSLPFEERSLTREVIESTYFKPATRTGWRRKPLLRLNQAVSDIQAEAKKAQKDPRRINLYCDTLVIPNGTDISLTSDSGLRLTIWCRKIIQEAPADGPAFSMTLTDGSALIIYATEPTPNFSVLFRLSDSGIKQTVVMVPTSKLGKAIQITDGTIQQEDRDAPDEDLHNMNYIKRIQDDGTVEEEPFWNDDLPRLIQFQLLVATSLIFRNTPLALSLLNFVCSATDVPSSRDYNFHATTLRSSIVARLMNDVSYVPSVDVHTSREVLASRLLAAKDFEVAFKTFVGSSQSTEYTNLVGANALYASKNALEEYSFLENLSRKHFDESTLALTKSQESFVTRQTEVKAAGDVFQAGVKEWKKDQEMEAIKQGIFAAIEVVGAIVATVATAGLAAPALVVAGASAAKAVSAFAQLVAKIKAVVEKLKAIYEKFKPLIKKIMALVEAIKKIISILDQAKAMSEQPNKLEPASTNMDQINGVRVWEDFVVDVNVMFEGIKPYGIPGWDGYQAALLKMSNSGRALLAAQTAVVTTGEALTSVILKKKLQTEQQTRLESALNLVGKNTQALNVLKRAMFDRVIAVRGLAFLDFWNYSLAYQYHTLSVDVPIGLSAVKPVIDYGDDAARLSAAVASFGAMVIVQQKNFIVNSSLSKDDVESLRSTGRVTMPLRVDTPEFEGFSRIRLKRARCFLRGLKSTATTPTPLQVCLTTDPRFFDRDLPKSYSTAGRVLLVDDAPTEAPPEALVRAFIGESRTVLFEYEGSDSSSSILCDGEFGQRDDYTKQTPFTNWTIDIRGLNGNVRKDLDWSEFSSLRWEFLCEVSLCRL